MIFVGGRFESGIALVTDERTGRVVRLARGDAETSASGDVETPVRVVRLTGRAMLPGMANAHSHAFQRVIRGRTEYRSSHSEDSFWTWREMMYAASARLTPEDIYDASRMAFMEMVTGGITSVGEFHYLHRTPEGAEYADPNLLSKQVVRAARDVGIRIALLRVAYARAGFRKPPDERQRRFIEPDADTFIRNTESLLRDLARDETEDGPTPTAWVGVAPHSVRAVPIEYILYANRFAVARGLPVHMHVAEQPAEIEACLAETGCTPLQMLGSEGVLGPHFTGVHVIHLSREANDIHYLKKSGATVCACPTTERNLGDGVVPADALLDAGVPIALGTDSHAQIDLLEDARELEYHMRLLRLRRNVLAPAHDKNRGDENREAARDDSVESGMSTLAARLFECATSSGARSIGAHAGELAPGRAADFFTVDLSDPSIAGASAQDLLPAIVFSLSRAAVRDVCVGGRLIVAGGRHAAQEEIVKRFVALQRKLWGSEKKSC